jgi:hypothetical protein
MGIVENSPEIGKGEKEKKAVRHRRTVCEGLRLVKVFTIYMQSWFVRICATS